LQVVLLVVCFAAIALPAQAQSLIANPNNGSHSCAASSAYCGTIEKVVGSTYTIVHSFSGSGPNGWAPNSPLAQDNSGNYYGTTEYGGSNNSCTHGCGTIFEISGSYPYALTTLYNFCSDTACADGANPDGGGLNWDSASDSLYGTTQNGGANGIGTWFDYYIWQGEINYTPYIEPVGGNPNNGMGKDSQGNFYGTTHTGGAAGYGAIFKLTTTGEMTALYSFQGAVDGANPTAGLLQATDGNFYGTTYAGGTADYGTIFKITPGGEFTALHTFEQTDGANPVAGLVQATDGNFYGTTFAGGSAGYGTAFKITPGGKLTTILTFDGKNGASPTGWLIQDTDGDLYGTASAGGAKGNGKIVKLSVGLRPFVQILPNSGGVGSQVLILGTDLSGATSVTFTGSNAAFKMKSTTEIIAIVPNGATSGTVQVVTPKGTLDSNVPFQVQ